MKLISIIKGWYGTYICKWCGGVAPYGICIDCKNKHE